jgi:hypothetical protein
MATYGKKASDKVEEAMHERKQGSLKSGRSGKKVTSRKQAIAIGLSEARKEGGKVPPAKKAGKKSSAKKSGAKKTATKKTAAKKSGARKTASKKTASRKTTAKKRTAKKTAAKKSRKSARKSAGTQSS